MIKDAIICHIEFVKNSKISKSKIRWFCLDHVVNVGYILWYWHGQLVQGLRSGLGVRPPLQDHDEVAGTKILN